MNGMYEKLIEKLRKNNRMSGWTHIDRLIDEAAEAIEALQVENEQLKADCDRMLGKMQELTMKYNYFKERLQISPYGDDKIDELDEALENYKFQYEQLKQENKQLRARVAQYREAEAAEKVLPTCNVTKLPCAGCNPCCEHREK